MVNEETKSSSSLILGVQAGLQCDEKWPPSGSLDEKGRVEMRKQKIQRNIDLGWVTLECICKFHRKSQMPMKEGKCEKQGLNDGAKCTNALRLFKSFFFGGGGEEGGLALSKRNGFKIKLSFLALPRLQRIHKLIGDIEPEA